MSKIPLILLALNTGLFAAESLYQDGWTEERFTYSVTGIVESSKVGWPFPSNYTNAICLTQYNATHYTYDYVMDPKNTASLVKVLKQDGVFAKCIGAQLVTK